MIEDFERKVGAIAEGWPVYDSHETLLFQIVRANHLIYNTVLIYSTIGLSNYLLRHRHDPEKHFRIELALCLNDEASREWVRECLSWFGTNAIKSGNCPLRGDLYSLNGSDIYIDDFVSIYVTIPLFLEDQKSVLYRQDGAAVTIGWLIPLKEAEDEYYTKNGWPKLEDAMEDHLQSLLNIPRPPMF